jgi:alpha-L-arabinofuranosidase
MRSAVAAGLGSNVFNRQADELYMCNIAQIVNVLQSLLLTEGPDGGRCVRTTTYHFSYFCLRTVPRHRRYSNCRLPEFFRLSG